MQGREDSNDVNAFVEKLDYVNSLQIIGVLKDSEYEKTSLASDFLGNRLILKELKDVSAKIHPYETLEGHCCKFLPKVYLALRVDTSLHVVMEALEGQTLTAKIKNTGPMRPSEALDCLNGVIRGVDYLHNSFEKPLIHRDIKPDNIIITDTGARLIDFGIMRSWEEQNRTDTACMGTKGYAAPEQFGFSQSDERTDIYALGCTFRFALTGKDPFENTVAENVVDDPVQSVLNKATAFDPAARYIWVGDFYADLKAAIATCKDENATTSPNSNKESKASAKLNNTEAESGDKEEAEYAPLEETTAESSTHTTRVGSQDGIKPRLRWRIVQAIALFFAVLSVVVGIDYITGKNYSQNPATTAAVAFLMFAAPLFIIADPFDMLRNRGLFDIGTGKRFLRCVAIGFTATVFIAAIESVVK